MRAYRDVKMLGHGEISGSAAAKQLPDIPCGGGAILKAVVGNTGNVYIGLSNAVTVKDGTQDATTGWELDAGQETPMLPVTNLNQLWIICDNAGDDLCYMTFQ